MKIRPVENWKLLGTEIQLDKTKVYHAVPATNQPEFEKFGRVFVKVGADSMLLEREEYEEVK